MIVSVKHLVCLTLLVGVLGGTTVFGLREATHKEMPIPAQAETIVGPVKLAMNLDKTTFKVGESINITLRFENIGNRTVWLGRSSPPVLDFVVYNESLQPIYAYYTSGGFIMISVSYRIEPGESLSKTFSWGQLEIDSFPPFASRQVAPGTYFIVGRTTPYASVFSSAEEPLITLETPKIGIQISSTA